MPIVQGLRGSELSLKSRAEFVPIHRKIRQLPEQIDDGNGLTSVHNRFKKQVNVVNMVNVAQHGMSHSTPNSAGYVPNHLWILWAD